MALVAGSVDDPHRVCHRDDRRVDHLCDRLAGHRVDRRVGLAPAELAEVVGAAVVEADSVVEDELQVVVQPAVRLDEWALAEAAVVAAEAPAVAEVVGAVVVVPAVAEEQVVAAALAVALGERLLRELSLLPQLLPEPLLWRQFADVAPSPVQTVRRRL